MTHETEATAYVCDICGRELKTALALRMHRDACLAKQAEALPPAVESVAQPVPSDRMGQESAIPAKETASPAAMMALTAEIADQVRAYGRANAGKSSIPTAVADINSTIGRLRSQIGRLPV